MTDRPNNPYSAPASQVDDGIPDGFSWTVALLAGSAGFGAAYTIGSLLSPLWQHLLIGSGVPIEQLYYACSFAAWRRRHDSHVRHRFCRPSRRLSLAFPVLVQRAVHPAAPSLCADRSASVAQIGSSAMSLTGLNARGG